MQSSRIHRVAALVAILLFGIPSQPSGHEIPNDVTVRMFVKPEGRVLRVLVRVPLDAMRDFNFPVRGPGYLEIAVAGPMLRDAAIMWVADYLEFYEEGTALGRPEVPVVRVSLPSDPSFGDYDAALAHITGAPLPDESDLIWNQALLDAVFEYPIASDESDFSFRSGLAHLGIETLTVLRFIPATTSERVFQFIGDPGLVRLDPSWYQAIWRFVALGFEHILDGFDHLLFLFCLVIPFRRFWSLVPIVTSFTVAHSITLIASAAGLAPDALWFPPLIETLIALSIVFMAVENIVGAKLERRWGIAFGFGLVHGFGFSFVLSESLQFAGGHLITSLLSFNLGVELGQLFVLVFMVPATVLLFKYVVAERMGTIILSVLLAHTGWHWMTDRGAELVQYQFAWPVLSVVFLATVMRWLMLMLIIAGAAWVLRVGFGKLGEWAGDRSRDARAET